MATIKNADRLLQRLNNIANMNVQETMSKATTLVHGQAKALAPVDTGNLAGSIRMKVTNKSNEVQGRVYTGLQYAPYVEFGTGSKGNGTYPYDVEGLSYRDTPWVYTPNGEDFYRTEGQVAQPYMYPALKMHEKTIKAMFNNDVHNQLKSNCKGG